jgi:hypothetical protein
MIMRQPVTPKCPGCGSDMYAQSWGSERKGVAKLHEHAEGFVTFRGKYDVRLTCASGCDVHVLRVTPELTAKQLDAAGALPLLEELCKR